MTISLTLGNTGLPFGYSLPADIQHPGQRVLGQPALLARLRQTFGKGHIGFLLSVGYDASIISPHPAPANQPLAASRNQQLRSSNFFVRLGTGYAPVCAGCGKSKKAPPAGGVFLFFRRKGRHASVRFSEIWRGIMKRTTAPSAANTKAEATSATRRPAASPTKPMTYGMTAAPK